MSPMHMLSLILLVAALILSILAALNYPYPQSPSSPPKLNLGWAAMACYFLSLMVGRFA